MLFEALQLCALIVLAGGVLSARWMLSTARASHLRDACASDQQRYLRWVAMACMATVLPLALARGDWLLILVNGAVLGALLFCIQRRYARAQALLALVLLLLQSLTSRSAHLPEPVAPVLADWAHLTLASAWLGGVALLAGVLLPCAMRQPTLAAEFNLACRRFSSLAMFCVAGLTMSGVAQAAAFVASLDDLIATEFGRALLTKIILFAVLIGFGAWHQFVVLPSLRLRMERAARFRVSLWLELSVSVALLVAAAVMKGARLI
jgi:putative copper export protein